LNNTIFKNMVIGVAFSRLLRQMWMKKTTYW